MISKEKRERLEELSGKDAGDFGSMDNWLEYVVEDLREKIASLVSQIEAKEEQLSKKKDEQENLELDEEDFVKDYDNMLDEVHGEVCFGELRYQASYVLKEVDPIAYRQGLLDYVFDGGIEISETDQWKELEEELEEIQDEISDLEENKDELEEELSTLEDEEDE